MTTQIEKFQQEQRDKSRLPKTFTITLAAEDYHRLMPHLRGLQQQASDNYRELADKQTELGIKIPGAKRWFGVFAAVSSLIHQLDR